jgi:four helix bundle protein
MHYLTISLGSAAELETQLLIVQRQYNKIDVVNALSLADEVQRMLNSMTSSYKY